MTGLERPRKGVGDGAAPGFRAGDGVVTGAPNVVVIFGDIGEMREVTKRTDDLDRRCWIKRQEDVFQGLFGLQIVFAMELN